MKVSFQKSTDSAGLAPLCLWLVDDHPELRELLAELLEKGGGLRCARQFSSAEAVLAALNREPAPDVILMDVNMHGMSGVDAVAPIKRVAHSTRVFIMTTFYDSFSVASARDNGASGFFLKSGDWDQAIATIQNISAEWTLETQIQIPVKWSGPGAEPEAEVCVRSSDRPDHTAKPFNTPASASMASVPQPILGRALSLVRSLISGSSRSRPPSGLRRQTDDVLFEGPV